MDLCARRRADASAPGSSADVRLNYPTSKTHPVVGRVPLLVDQLLRHKTDVEVTPSPVHAGIPPAVVVLREDKTGRM